MEEASTIIIVSVVFISLITAGVMYFALSIRRKDKNRDKIMHKMEDVMDSQQKVLKQYRSIVRK